MTTLLNRLHIVSRGFYKLTRRCSIPQTFVRISEKQRIYPLHQQPRFFHLTFCCQKIVPFNLADIGEGIQEVVVKEWFVKEGDTVSQFDNVCEVQSDKASVTISSRYDGVIKKIYYETDDTAFVGKPLLDVEVTSDDLVTVGAEVQEGEAIAIGNESTQDDRIELPSSVGTRILTTPAVRRIAMEYKIDLAQVQGSGRDGRIMKEDVLKFIDGKSKSKASLPVQEIVPPPPQPKEIKPVPKPVPVLESDRTVAIKGYQKAMVKSMTASLKIPHFGYCDEVDMSKLVEMKSDVMSQLSHYGLRFSYMPFFIKAASIALQSYPILNSSVDENCENIIYRASHNIGFAMDTNNGLVVPNIKGVQNLTMLQISQELQRLMECGKKGSFSTADITGGTFTLSNIGSIGGTYAKPVIMAPQVAIGAIGRTQKLPRFDDAGNVVAAHLLKVSWSADHRVIDGATMSRFSNVWKNLLEKPSTMALFMK